MTDHDEGAVEGRREALELNNEAATFLREGKPGLALPLLLRAAELLPEDANVMLNLGAVHMLQGRFAEAATVLKEAIKSSPDEPLLWCNLGAALLQVPTAETEESERLAIRAFERALELDDDAGQVAYNLGLIHRRREDWEAAARCFRLALEADPTDEDARSLLSRMEARLDEKE
jgi:tetratricopeptide (TPR) repeat protein